MNPARGSSQPSDSRIGPQAKPDLDLGPIKTSPIWEAGAIPLGGPLLDLYMNIKTVYKAFSSMNSFVYTDAMLKVARWKHINSPL
jgi:hypothetical protein